MSEFELLSRSLSSLSFSASGQIPQSGLNYEEAKNQSRRNGVMQFHTHTPKEEMVGTTRRVVRERCLPPAHIQPDGPAVRPYHPNVGVYDAFKREMVSVVPPEKGSPIKRYTQRSKIIPLDSSFLRSSTSA
jgi:hypothetical protein